MRQIGAAKIEVEFDVDHASPFFRKGPDLALERPGVARLLKDLPIGLGNRRRPHRPAGVEVGECRFSFPLPDPLAHPGGIDAGVDHQVGDMDAPRPELARGTLGYGTQTDLALAKAA
jgi:hypothetical protein